MTNPNISLKLARAKRLSKIGRYHSSFSAMAGCISRDLAVTLTSRQIAIMIDDLWDACQQAKAIGARETREAA